ncbi:NUDIX hydrolase (plasmid) [Halolamina sp. CBA1230]|uniref:NUDIX hydrolase n=1 Tax=Halolamina sp. CBA1230 TaxID=1853690 RepID=UPI0009A235E3|nr:NUDIX domain-containing protein [Halolamina sp. CBA1230]QKY22017.1 NUDIX hydrolase [Halolamina sp. CBA1230]
MGSYTLTYCPTCGTVLVDKQIEGRTRRYCQECETPIYRNPKPCAGVLVVDEGDILLVKRTQPPGVGTWSVPAGFLEYDEPPALGAVRELEEETSVTASEEDLELFDTAFVTAGERENVLVIIYRVERSATKGDPEPGSDAGDAQFWEMGAFESEDEQIEPGYEDIFQRARRL